MFKRLSLSQEIVFALIIKLILLYGLWLLCFSDPIEKKLKLTDISDHLFIQRHYGKY